MEINVQCPECECEFTTDIDLSEYIDDLRPLYEDLD